MTAAAERRLLIAGMGNVLRGDDGFGVAVAGALEERDWGAEGPEVEVVEVGIGGLHLVQRLQDGYDALVIVDAVDRGAEPGRIFVLEPSVPEADDLSAKELRSVVAETHHTVPARVLTMARALGVLPRDVLILGCQTGDGGALGMELSTAVADAVPRAVERLETLVEAYRRDGRLPSASDGAGHGDARRTMP